MSESDWEDVATGNDDGWEDVGSSTIPIAASPSRYSGPTAWLDENIITPMGQVGQGATFNFADEMSAGIGALANIGIDKASSAIGYPTDLTQGATLGQAYDDYLAQIRGQDKAYQTEHPVASVLENVAGGFINPVNKLIPKGMLSPLPGVAPALKNTAKVAGLGGVFGAGYGFGGGEGLSDRLLGSAIGAGTGFLTGGALQGLIQGGQGAYGALKNLIGPQTSQGALSSVGQSLSNFVGLPEITSGIKALSKDPLGAMRTSAEVLKKPQLAILEQNLGGSGPKSLEYAAQKAQRSGAEQFILDAVSPAKNVLEENSGKIAQDIIAATKAADKKVVSDLYDLIPAGTEAKLGGLKIAAQDLKATYFGPGGGKFPARLKDAFDFIVSPKNKGHLTINELKNARSELIDISKVAYKAGNNQEGAMASQLADAVKNTIGNAPAGAKEWTAANKAAAEYFTKYQGTAQQTAPLKDIAKILPSKVYNKIMSSPEAAQQFKTIVNGQPKAIQSIKDQIASDLSTMTDAQRATFISNNESQLKTLLGSDFDYLDSIRKSIRSRIDTQKLANATAGPNTALKLSGVVERALTGKNAPKQGFWNDLVKVVGAGASGAAIFANPLVAIPAALTGVGVKALRDRSGRLVQNALYDALDRPTVLKQALTLANAPKPPAQASSAARATLATTAAESQFRSKPEYKSDSDFISQAMDRAEAKVKTTLKAPEVLSAKRIEPDNYQQVAKSLVPAVTKQESAGNPKAVSPKGATGLMQLMPGTAREVAQKLGIKNPDLKDPETNVKLGTEYLAQMLKLFKGDVKLALAAYNAGPDRVQKWQSKYGSTWSMIEKEIRKRAPKHETLNYVSKILNNFETKA